MNKLHFTFYCLILTFFYGCAAPSPFLSNTHLTAIEFNRKAETAFNKEEYEKALQFYSEALKAGRSIDDTDGTAANLINKAAVYRKLNKRSDAHACLDEALCLSPSTTKTEAAYLKALLRMDEADLQGAAQWSDKASVLCEEKCPAMGRIYNLKARIALSKGEPESAAAFASRGLECASARENREEEANALRLMAEARLLRNDFPEALKLYEKTLAADKILGLSRKVFTDLMGIGTLLLKQQRPDEAVKFFERALSVGKESGDKRSAQEASEMLEKCRNSSGKK
jgi:tetratricopeptide (TPR) repeat protein